MEHDEKKENEEQQTEERDEMEDLDVSQKKAEDVKGGAAISYVVPRYPDPPISR